MTYDLLKVKTLLSSPEGQDLTEFLQAELMQLRLIDSIKAVDHPFGQAVEVVAQKKAYQRVSEILAKVGVITSNRPPLRDPRDSIAM
jgi:hypothetical protein